MRTGNKYLLKNKDIDFGYDKYATLSQELNRYNI